MVAQQRERSGRRGVLRVLAAVVAVVVALAVVVVVAVATLGVRVDGHSMQPTLLDGQRLLTAPGSGGAVHRFDVVLLRPTGRDATVVKRVVGLPGDRVEIRAATDEPYQVLVQPGGAGAWYRVDFPAWAGQAHRTSDCCTSDGTRTPVATAQTVPPGRFFFLGDNPDGSDDSRTFGWGQVSAVSGRVALRVWPLDVLGGLGAGPVLTAIPNPAEQSG
ncbi:signal peptidase I [Kitasatospora sp. NPDC058965]|uniref:signal peptidase I n=1 Tax=Kitasatospora sp. NPDC058965 TaxID=3346682 RepID=UPI00368D6DA5